MGTKPHDWNAVPLCRPCHDLQGKDEKGFWARLGIDPGRVGMALYLAQDHEEREDIIEANRTWTSWPSASGSGSVSF
jgi:hypothetical protein